MHDSPRKPPTLILDLEKYRPYLEHAACSPEERDEILRLLWSIICEFVLLGYDIHPVHQAQETCGKSDEDRALLPKPGPNELDLYHHFQNTHFNNAAQAQLCDASERIQE